MLCWIKISYSETCLWKSLRASLDNDLQHFLVWTNNSLHCIWGSCLFALQRDVMQNYKFNYCTYSFSTDDKTRVRLGSIDDELGSDYINANYIPVSCQLLSPFNNTIFSGFTTKVCLEKLTVCNSIALLKWFWTELLLHCSQRDL